MIEQIKRKISNVLITTIFLSGKKFEDISEKMAYHEFDKGDVLVLKNRNTSGYDVRPVAVVNGYSLRKYPSGKEGTYDVDMYTDIVHEFSQGVYQNKIPEGVERIVNEHEIYPNHYVETQFKKVSVNSVDEALNFYASGRD